MGSTALAAAVPYPGKVTQISTRDSCHNDSKPTTELQPLSDKFHFYCSNNSNITFISLLSTISDSAYIIWFMVTWASDINKIFWDSVILSATVLPLPETLPRI